MTTTSNEKPLVVLDLDGTVGYCHCVYNTQTNNFSHLVTMANKDRYLKSKSSDYEQLYFHNKEWGKIIQLRPGSFQDRFFIQQITCLLQAYRLHSLFPEYSVKQIVLVDDSETNSENYPENLVLSPPFSPSTSSTASQIFTEPDEYFNSGVALCAIQTAFKELHAPIINNNDVSKKRKREETTVAIVKKQET